MDTIIELVNIAKPNKQLLRGKVLALVEGIQGGTIQNKEDAIEQLFKDNVDPEHAYLYLLRRANKMLWLSVVSSVKGKNKLQRVYNEVHGAYSSVMILLAAGKRQAAITEARRIYKLAAKFELIYIASSLATKLTRHYAEFEHHPRLQMKYAKEATYYADQIALATKVNNYYSKILSLIEARPSYTPRINKLLRQSTAEIKDQLSTTTITVQYFILEIIRCFAIYDYARAALTCTLALEELEDRETFTIGQKTWFLFLKSVSAIAARRYDFAEETLVKAIKDTTHSVYNYQMLTYYRTINAIHDQRYYSAQMYFEEASKRKQITSIKEHWAILNAYLHYINGERFRLGKFFNETLVASQDKMGMNVNIIIADLLISLQQNRDRFLHRIEAVKNYRYRHLKGKAEERARFFLELLFQLPRCDFDRRRVERATGHIQRKLERRSLHANHNLEIEIVPFEVLWNLVLDRLENNTKSRRLSK